MFVGEAPGAREDEQGLPFVGQAGRLLDTLLEEIGLERGDVFIANVLKCRPPGNRDPLPQEIDTCQDYLFRQLELIEPRVVCTLGQLRHQAAARRPGDRASRACTGARRSADRAAARCGCTRSTTRRPRSTRRGCSTRCARTSRGCPSCWRSIRRRSPSREPEPVVPEPELRESAMPEARRPPEPPSRRRSARALLSRSRPSAVIA